MRPKHPYYGNNISLDCLSKEPTIKQVQAEMCQSSSNSRSNPPSKDINRTEIPKSIFSNYKLDKSEKQPHSASPRKKTVITKKPLQKSTSIIEMNVVQQYNHIMNHQLCELSANISAAKKHNASLYTTTINQTQAMNIHIDKIELNRSYTKDTNEEIQEPLSTEQIVFIKRILLNEDLIPEQMDDNIK